MGEAVATVSGDALMKVALEMEQAGKAGDLTAISARVPEMERQLLALAKAVEKMQTEPAPERF